MPLGAKEFSVDIAALTLDHALVSLHNHSRLLILLCLAFVLLGPGLLAYGLWRLYVGVRPRRWKQLPGIITVSRTELQYVRSGSYQCVPVIEYQVEHAGGVLHGKGDIFTIGNRENTEAIIAKYPVGATVTVLVNPLNPTQTSLQARISPESWVFIVSGLLLTAADSYLVPEIWKIFNS